MTPKPVTHTVELPQGREVETLDRAAEQIKQVEFHLNGDEIVIPTSLRVEKDGLRTLLFCAKTGKELVLPWKAQIKLNLADFASPTVKISFDASVSEIEFVDRQLPLPGTP